MPLDFSHDQQVLLREMMTLHHLVEFALVVAIFLNVFQRAEIRRVLVPKDLDAQVIFQNAWLCIR